MRDKVRTILKEWLQSKDDIVFTDDIAIEEVTDEIVEACRQKCTIPIVSGSLPLASNIFNEITDLRPYLLRHPDQEMVRAACLHYLGDEAQKRASESNDL